MRKLIVLAVIIGAAVNLPLRTKLYPRILARGIEHSKIYFYNGNRRLTLSQSVQKPARTPKGTDDLVKPIWEFLDTFDRFMIPPFDKNTPKPPAILNRTSRAAPTSIAMQTTTSITSTKLVPTSTTTKQTTTKQTTTTTKPTTKPTTTQVYQYQPDRYLENIVNTNPTRTILRFANEANTPWECGYFPYREWFENNGGVCGIGDWQMPVNRNRRSKRELPWDCSWPPTRLIFEWKGGICAEGISDSMKKILAELNNQQTRDRHAIEGIRKMTDFVKRDQHDLFDELEKTERVLQDELKETDSSMKAMAKLTLQVITEFAYSNILNTYSLLWRASQRPTMGLGDVPEPMRNAIREAVKDGDDQGIISKALEANVRALLNPMVAFNETDLGVSISLTTHLPEIIRACQVFQLQPLGLKVGSNCMSGPDISGTAVVECDGEQWLVASECLSACYQSANQEYFCHENECGNPGSTPDWIDLQPANGQLVAPRVAEYALCHRQPSMVYVGNNKYLLTRDAEVQTIAEKESFNGVTPVTKTINGRAGMIFNASCNGDVRVKIGEKSFIGQDCDSQTPVTADVGCITLKDNVLQWISEIDKATDWHPFIERLKNESLVDRLNKSTHIYHQINTKVEANLKDASEIQLKLAAKIQNLETTDYTTVRLSERIAIALALIMSTFSAIAVCCLFRILPFAGRGNFIPINKIEIEDVPSAPILTPPQQVFSGNRNDIPINNPWSELTADEARMVRELMQTSQFCNVSDREVAAFVANTCRPNGSRHNDPFSRSLLGM